MKSKDKISLSVVVIGSCVALLLSSWLLVDVHREYRLLQEELSESVQILKQRKTVYEKNLKKARILDRVRRFVGKARALGLAPEEWQSYEVSVKEPLMFEEIQEILGQTVSGQGHFFMPLSLTLLRPKEIHEVPETSEKKKGDLLVEIQGRFFVRAR